MYSIVNQMRQTQNILRPIRGAAIASGRLVIRRFGIATSAMRPDPDFLLIGAKRGGSTSFYYDLITHPQVAPLFPRPERLPKASATKGIHYFDSNYYRGYRWYASHLPSLRVRRRQQAVAGGRVITGEGSPYYLTHPSAPERVAHDLPHVKLVAVLRDPVERAYSHWKERVREGMEPLSFAEAIDREPDRVGDAAERLRRNPHFYSYAHEHQSYLEQSRYGAALDRWRAVFPMDSILVIRSEDYYADPGAQLDLAALHLGIEPGRFQWGDVRNAAPGSDLMPELRHHLQDLLRSDARHLQELTGVTWDWV
jgi:hypothetical protein